MTRIRRAALLLVAVAASALLLAGCTVNGGGWIPGDYAKKATFGFTWTGMIASPCSPGGGSNGVVDGGEEFPIVGADPVAREGRMVGRIGQVPDRDEGGLEALGYFDDCWYGRGPTSRRERTPVCRATSRSSCVTVASRALPLRTRCTSS